MKWVNSGGGPIVCSEKEYAKEWRGINGLSIKIDTARSDYDRACAVSEYLASVECASGKVLILGDEPLQSSFFRNSGRLILVRWIYSKPSNVDIILPRSLDDLVTLNEPIEFFIRSGELILFDSAVPGTEATKHAPTEKTSPGMYHVTVQKYHVERQHSFLIHQFIKN